MPNERMRKRRKCPEVKESEKTYSANYRAKQKSKNLQLEDQIREMSQEIRMMKAEKLFSDQVCFELLLFIINFHFPFSLLQM